MPKYLMALDQGTTSSRCILFDTAGNICSMVQKEFRQIYPREGGAGRRRDLGNPGDGGP